MHSAGRLPQFIGPEVARHAQHEVVVVRLVATREAPSFDVDGGEDDGVADAVARSIGPR